MLQLHIRLVQKPQRKVLPACGASTAFYDAVWDPRAHTNLMRERAPPRAENMTTQKVSLSAEISFE
jgi:hypothetical protein